MRNSSLLSPHCCRRALSPRLTVSTRAPYSCAGGRSALDQMRREGVLRMFKLPTAADDYACMFTADYRAQVRFARRPRRSAAQTWMRWVADPLLARVCRRDCQAMERCERRWRRPRS